MTPGPILVTGARGFVGSHVVEEFARAGHDVLAWGRAELDLLDRDAVRAALGAARPGAICHCAGAPSAAEAWGNSAEVLNTNVVATANLVDAVRDLLPGTRILNIGSSTVYREAGEPLTEAHPVLPRGPYALSKLAQELVALGAWRDDGLDVVATRSFNHTGPRQLPAFAAPAFARQLARIEAGLDAPVLRVGNLSARRDLTDVRDVARAYRLILEHGRAGTWYNVCSGIAYAIQDVVDGLCARVAVTVTVEVDPARYRPNDAPAVTGDHGLLTRDTGWTPAVSFDRMLDDLLAYWRTTVRTELAGGG